MIPLLSVAIATKNREEFCIKSVQSILDMDDPRIEISISDNSSTTKVRDYVDSIQSSQIKYFYTNDQISSIDNFNSAVEQCTGEFVTLIGDDDTILSSMMLAAEWMKQNNIETLSSKRNQRYFWPKSRPQSPTGTLHLFRFSKSLNIVNAREEIIKAAKLGINNFYDFRVAMSYHGIVKRDLMEKVKKITGNYYGALSPDVFSVMTLSYLSKKHCYIDYPLSIMGVCRDSTSAHQIYGEHVGKLDSMPHLKNRRDHYKWDHRVAEYYCVTNTWAESGINALEAINAKDVLKEVNIYPVIAMGILMNRKYILSLSVEESEKLRKRNKIAFLPFWTRTVASGIRLSAKKYQAYLKIKVKVNFQSRKILKILNWPKGFVKKI